MLRKYLRKHWHSERAMGRVPAVLAIASLTALLSLTACGGGGGGGGNTVGTASQSSDSGGASATSGGSGGTSSGSGGSSSTNSSTTANYCDVPTPWPLPATSQVVGTGTPGSCTFDSLNAAVSNGGLITFNCGAGTKTISVTSEIQASSTTPTIVDGGGKIILDGGGHNRIFTVAQGRQFSARNLTLQNGYAMQSDVTAYKPATYGGSAISGNYQSKVEIINSTFLGNHASLGGGAVFVGSDADLTVVGSSFSKNSSWYGGALLSLLSRLTIVNSTFSYNNAVLPADATNDPNAPGGGGAIMTDGTTTNSYITGGIGSGGTISMCGTTVSNNTAQAYSGGANLWAYAPDNIIVKYSTFENNTALHGPGGAGRISVGPTTHSQSSDGTVLTPGTINIIGSSFISNSASGNGGALYVDCYGDCNLTNSTFYGNTTSGVGGAIQHVGFVTNPTKTITYNNDTFYNNVGWPTLFGSKFVINNTVLETGSEYILCNANSSSTGNTGNNVLEYSTKGPLLYSCFSSGNIIAKDAQLNLPANNGGPTKTMLPTLSSPLLGAGSSCENTDQRGYARNPNNCTIGAVEGTH